MLKRIIGYILISFFCTSATWALGLPGPGEDLLLDDAENFLTQLDQNEFSSAWQQTSPLFRILTDEAAWKHKQQVLRQAYGPLESRRFLRLSYRTTYAHSPDGIYVIIQYQSHFENKAETRETVVLCCHADSECVIREYVLR